MTKNESLSKTLSFLLRHKPDAAGLRLDKHGWCSVGELLQALGRQGIQVTEADISDVVESSDKKRFALSSDNTRIRANQGHTVGGVDLQLKRAVPPVCLYHGTIERFLPEIFKKGLLPMKRHHVHLSGDQETATAVGARRGKPLVLEVDARSMLADGRPFFLSENGVWLTDNVASKYLKLLK